MIKTTYRNLASSFDYKLQPGTIIMSIFDYKFQLISIITFVLKQRITDVLKTAFQAIT